MMTTTIILFLSGILIFAYLGDVVFSKLKIPSVFFLLGIGAALHFANTFVKFDLPRIDLLLPVLGTIGLLLIVLEGSLELSIEKENTSIIKKALLNALLPLLGISLALTFGMVYVFDVTFKTAILNAIPLSVISSAIAIPSVKALSPEQKEFITYESSFSDIFGVLLFNFILLNEEFQTFVFGVFVGQIVLMILISIIVSLLLAYLIYKINHHVKFLPILLVAVFVYAFSKYYHLPSLLFIMLFGLFLSNIGKIQFVKKYIVKETSELESEIQRFHSFLLELTFLVRALFFILFGYTIQWTSVWDPNALLYSSFIVLFFIVLRTLFLWIHKVKVFPAAFIAPRGLITVLLFLSIPLSYRIKALNETIILQVILISTAIMLFGTMGTKSSENQKQ